MTSAEDGWFLRQQIRGFKRLGYTVYHKMLDAFDYGVPQNRRRIFIVGVRDVRGAMKYEFPPPAHGRWERALTLSDSIGGWEEWPEGEFFDYPFHGHYLTRTRKRRWEEPSFAIVANVHHVPLHPMGAPMRYVEKDTWALEGTDNRRLSWRECAAIQALPPGIAPTGTLKDKHRVVGTAVPPPLARALIRPVVSFEQRKGSRCKQLRNPRD
jgi:DNA (cytosine-5)-methyltransferase 1